MDTTPIVCCVIVLDKDGRLLLVRRGKDPYMNKWALVSGVGYAKKGKTIEEGVVDEVVGDVVATPSQIKRLSSLDDNSQEVIVFSAQVNVNEVVPVAPHANGLMWCDESEFPDLSDLAFDHGEILSRYLLVSKQKT